MYSVVLMMALTTSGEVPDFCRGCRGCRGCWGCNGCYGCHGCRGWRGGCHGCWGCGGCYSYGCHGCYGGGCWGGWGCHGCHGGGVITGGTTTTGGGEMKKTGEEMGRAPRSASPATILVTLPAEAKLTVDDHPTTSTSGQRRFASPPLQPGKDFHYTLKAEMVRDGETVVATKRVTVRAGQETRVTLEFPTAAVASR